MFKKISIATVILITLIIVGFGGIYISGNSNDNQIKTLLTVTSFLFSTFLSFTIYTSNSKLSRLNELVSHEQGVLLYISRLFKVFDKKTQDELRGLIDNYLTTILDYNLVDYEKSNTEYLELFDYINTTKTENKFQELALSNVIYVLFYSTNDRKQIESLVHQKVNRFEWFSIIILVSLLIGFLIYLNNGSIIYILSVLLLSISSVILVIALRDIDNLRWREKQWWLPMHSLFIELGLIPYYPKKLIDLKRVILTKGQRVRLVTYPNPYPDIRDKKVEITEI